MSNLVIQPNQITTPAITSPTDTAIDVSLAAVITSSAYATSALVIAPHFSKTWEIATDSAFTTIIFSSTDDEFNLTSIVATGLSVSTLYYLRARDKSLEFVSEWSPTISYTTDDDAVNTPTLTVEGSPSDVPETPILTTSAFTTVLSTDTHATTDWEIRSSDNLTSIWTSAADAVNLLTIEVPVGTLSEATAYIFKARHNGTALGAGHYVSETNTTVANFGYLAVSHTTTPFITIYATDIDTSTKLDDPTTLPTGNSTGGVTFSTDGVYMAVAHGATPFATIYKREGDVFTKLADPSTLPPSTTFEVSFSSDAVYLAYAAGATPYVTIYKRAGDVFTKLADPSTLPGGTSAFGIAFSAGVVYLTVASNATPFITIYKRAADVFTKLTNPATLPTGISHGVAFSTDDVYMAVAHEVTPFITIYKRSGDTFTKLSDPATLPASNGREVAFSKDVVYMAVAHVTSPYITIYKRSGDTFTKLSDPATLPGSTGLGVEFSEDGVYLAVGTVSSPYVTIYKRAGDVFTKLANPAALPTGSGYGIGYWPRSLA